MFIFLSILIRFCKHFWKLKIELRVLFNLYMKDCYNFSFLKLVYVTFFSFFFSVLSLYFKYSIISRTCSGNSRYSNNNICLLRILETTLSISCSIRNRFHTPKVIDADHKDNLALMRDASYASEAMGIRIIWLH